MGGRIQASQFIPSSVGLTYPTLYPEGRILIPASFRSIFGKGSPPIEVSFCLSGKGFVSVHPSDKWPLLSERKRLTEAQKILLEVEPERLTPEEFETTQAFFRLLGGRYVAGIIQKKWLLPLPATIRSWLGIPSMPAQLNDPIESAATNTISKLLAVGTFGAIELWNEDQFKDALPTEASMFVQLTVNVNNILEHARISR